MTPAGGDGLNGQQAPDPEPKTGRSIPKYSSMPNSGDHAEGSRRKSKSMAAVPESLQVIAGGEDGNGDHYRVIRFTKQDGGWWSLCCRIASSWAKKKCCWGPCAEKAYSYRAIGTRKPPFWTTLTILLRPKKLRLWTALAGSRAAHL